MYIKYYHPKNRAFIPTVSLNIITISSLYHKPLQDHSIFTLYTKYTHTYVIYHQYIINIPTRYSHLYIFTQYITISPHKTVHI